MPVDSAVLAAILESLTDPVVFADTEHTVRYINKAAEPPTTRKAGPCSAAPSWTATTRLRTR